MRLQKSCFLQSHCTTILQNRANLQSLTTPCYQFGGVCRVRGAGVWQVLRRRPAANHRSVRRGVQIRSAGLRCPLRLRAGRCILRCRCRQVSLLPKAVLLKSCSLLLLKTCGVSTASNRSLRPLPSRCRR